MNELMARLQNLLGPRAAIVQALGAPIAIEFRWGIPPSAESRNMNTYERCGRPWNIVAA